MFEVCHLELQGEAKLTGEILEGHRSTLIPQLGNIAYRTGRVLTLDPTNGHIVGDPEDAKLWGREYDKNWAVKV
ncbi:MAG: hypothetical protein LH606_08280 [Cytophagaceae bacterium]|nr:hypothetical protein [Cytophagaceae bacterium]